MMKKHSILIIVLLIGLTHVLNANMEAQTINKAATDLHENVTESEIIEKAERDVSSMQSDTLPAEHKKAAHEKQKIENSAKRNPSQVALMIIGLMVAVVVFMFNG